MNANDTAIKKILDSYSEDFAENTWPVPGGKARAILHKCIERMAAKAGIKFDLPQIVDASPDNVVLIVSGSMTGGEPVWSFGEASPKNNKNAYVYSMAEKRGKDRVALKLIGLHGLLYSEEEAEDFKQPAEAKAKPEPALVEAVVEAIQGYTDEELAIAETLEAALKLSRTGADLTKWGKDNRDVIDGLPSPLKNRVYSKGATWRRHLENNVRAA